MNDLDLLADLGYRDAVRRYQHDSGLIEDGALGDQTRAAIVADLRARHISELQSYRGSFGLLVRLEGHVGRPYWPRGNSGVTLDIGWDLANGRNEELERLYGPLWSAEAFDELKTACGLRGAEAQAWTQTHDLSRWPITREQAANALPHAAVPYWLAALKVSPSLALHSVPARCQTALLSVTYNSWTGCLQAGRELVEAQDWGALADLVKGWGGTGHAQRRAIEADLILRAV